MSITFTKGLKFPLELVSGKPVLSEGIDLIKASIQHIVTWPLGTANYEDYFGSKIGELIEEPNDIILMALTQRYVVDSISNWENRVILKKLTFYRPDAVSLIVNMEYNIKSENIDDSTNYVLY